MVTLLTKGAYLLGGKTLVEDSPEGIKMLEKANVSAEKDELKKGTIAYSILEAHNVSGNMDKLNIKFDAMASHDITYVGIVQTARASGLERFPIPYVLTNCHNSLCAVGGTINEDDHMFGLSAAKKYGGIYVPAHQAVIHSYMREMMSGCGKMILGSDSHTRYGALGTMAIGEGGPELVKQLLNKTYDISCPEVVAVYLTGKVNKGVGPQDVALAIIGAVFKNGFVKNKVMEFVGDGIEGLDMEFRNGIDVMTTETTCLSSIWTTDNKTKEYFEIHRRPEEFKELKPKNVAYYDAAVVVELDKIKPMIAMPFHPSNVYDIETLNANLEDILHEIELEGTRQLASPNVSLKLLDKIENGRLKVSQGVIAGCAGGTFDNLCAVADIVDGKSIGNDEFSFSVYPASQPVFLELMRNGCLSKIMATGATVRSAFCGPCFGAGDVPANNGLSIRHSTRNFPNREGSKPNNNQIASVALMDARSIAATAVNKGYLTPATDIDADFTARKFFFDSEIYNNRVYFGFGKANPSEELKLGPNITDWPSMSELTDDIMLKVVSVIEDPVTTTDELIPSGETSSYRSNPLKLAEFALSRKDPAYVGKAKEVQVAENARLSGTISEDFVKAFEVAKTVKPDLDPLKTEIGSTIFARKPGDGSAREQAASCQRVLGGLANIAFEYATKRYRSNLINWGMLPFVIDEGDLEFNNGDFIFVPEIRKAVINKASEVDAYVINDENCKKIVLKLSEMTDDERQIILDGCLINYYKN